MARLRWPTVIAMRADPTTPGVACRRSPPPLESSPEELEIILRQVEDIGTLVTKKYDGFEASIAPEDHSSFHIGLAPSYRNPTGDSLKMMDMTLLLAMETTLRTLAGRDMTTMSWEEGVSLMRQNPALKDLKRDVFRHDTLSRPPRRHIGSQSAPPSLEDEIEIEKWLRDLVQDVSVFADTQITTKKVLDGIAASADVAVKSLWSLIHKREIHSTPMLDIGIIRFPDRQQPYFRLYRVQLDVWVKRKTSFSIKHTDSSGIYGRYYSCDFGPCEEILALVDPQVKRQALKETEALLRQQPPRN